jgi:hypothetical protein
MFLHHFDAEALLAAFFFLPPFLLVRLAFLVGVGVGVSGGGIAPLRRIHPSLSVSVMMRLAAGRYWCSFEYLYIVSSYHARTKRRYGCRYEHKVGGDKGQPGNEVSKRQGHTEMCK